MLARTADFLDPRHILQTLLLAVLLLGSALTAAEESILVEVVGSGSVLFTDGTETSCTATAANSCDLSGFGETFTLTASPGSGFEFASWSGFCASSGSSLSCTFQSEDNSNFVSTTATFIVLIQDDDNDGVKNDIDECLDTPADTAVDEVGCSLPPVEVILPDGDIDGVIDLADQCPNTPLGQPVDGIGCSASQLDDDSDGVTNDIDQCPDTPAGTTVDEAGCDTSIPDEDNDGVNDDLDQCPGTPSGTEVDEQGCALSDPEEPVDPVDPEVPEDGDDDLDGVSNSLDLCPATPEGTTVDSDGCPQDTDGDGVPDDEDACPDTSAPTAGPDGCSVTQNFGNELGSIGGLSKNERSIGARVDEICPMLIGLEQIDDLSQAERDLRDACVGLKNRGTSEDQAADALGEVSLTELAAMLDYVVELSNGQHSHLGARLRQVTSDDSRGVSMRGLNIRMGDEIVPAGVLESAFEDLLGMAAGENGFVDFGRLGLFIQGDIDIGEKDETELETGYDFDAWSITFGGDYRFTDTLFGGLSLSMGEVDVDYEGLSGSSNITNWSLAAYGGLQLTPAWYLDGLVSYGQSEFDLTRRVVYTDVSGTFDTTQKSNTDGDQIFFGLNTGYMWNSGGWRGGPIASITYLDGDIDGFDETTQGPNSQAWNFIVDDRAFKSLRLNLGLQADYIWNTSFGVLVPGVRVAYVMENEDEPEDITLRLKHNPFGEDQLESQTITVETDGRDSRFIDASLNLSGQFKMGFSGFASYQFYSSYDNYEKTGYTLGLRWDKPF